MKKLMFIVGCLFFMNAQPLHAQLQAELSIRNGEIINDEVFFDIYIRESGPTNGTINLSHTDFVLMINENAFNSPSLYKVENPAPPLGAFQNGYCNLVPTNSDGEVNDWNCQTNYFSGTAVELTNGYFVINLNAPTATDQGGFDNRIAIIDDGMEQRFGRFKISGFVPGSVVDIDWEVDPVDFVTQVFSYNNTLPFQSVEVPVIAIDPLPIMEPASIREDEGRWEVVISPNPTTDKISLELNEIQNNMTYEIIDAMGRSYKQGEINSLNAQIFLGNLAAGIYWLQLKTPKNQPQTHKIIKL